MLSKFNFLFFIASIAFSITSVKAQYTNQHFEQGTIPYIEVIGSAEKEVIPDEIYIRITIRERIDGRKTIGISEQEDALKKAILNLGLSLDDLSFSDANTDYITVRWRKKDAISQVNYTMKTTDATSTAKLFEKLDALRIKDAFIAKTDYSKKEELRREVKIKALKAAKEKAEYLVNSVGNQLGKPLKITEQEQPTHYNRSEMAMSNFAMETDFEESQFSELQFEKIKYRYKVYTTFEIK